MSSHSPESSSGPLEDAKRESAGLAYERALSRRAPFIQLRLGESYAVPGTDINRTYKGRIRSRCESVLFQPGGAVKVMNRSPIGHYRVPIYLRGKRGVVQKVIEPMQLDNEREGYGQNGGDKRHYYRIAFSLGELWPDYA
jgi:hypothetical protein